MKNPETGGWESPEKEKNTSWKVVYDISTVPEWVKVTWNRLAGGGGRENASRFGSYDILVIREIGGKTEYGSASRYVSDEGKDLHWTGRVYKLEQVPDGEVPQLGERLTEQSIN